MSRPRVLIVEDDRSVSAALRRLMHRTHEVALASDGREALELLLRGERFHAIVSDVTMPNMTGIELYEQVARQVPDQTRGFVFLTGGVQGATARALRQTGAPHLEKPVDISELRQTLADLAGGAPPLTPAVGPP